MKINTPTPSSKTKNPYLDPDLLNEICNMTCDRIDDFLDWFSVDLRRFGSTRIGCCPVHGGDRNTALNLYEEGYSARGYWECQTRKCSSYQNKNLFMPTILGFARGVMSHHDYGWSKEGDDRVTHQAAVDEVCRLLGVKVTDVKVDRKKIARGRFQRRTEILSPTGRPPNEFWTQEDFHASHEIPSSYYLKRGYREETLRLFGVGECIDPGHPMYERTNVPIYDLKGEIILGVVSRSNHSECPSCGFHHSGETPCCKDGSLIKSYLRWVVQPDGFSDKHHLYNLWRSRPRILKSRCIVVVEGAGDVWRLHEAGIQNAVAIFGSKVSNLQEIEMELCSPSHMVVMTDSDDAGDDVADKLLGTWKRRCRVTRLKPLAKDLGEMTTKEVEKEYRSVIQQWMK